MATLEKIRSKSVLLIVVIGVALLAFIVGDALTNGQNLFGDPTTVAKVDGEKIDVTLFQRELEERSQQNQNSQRPMDEQLLTKQVLDQMIMETLINSAIEKLGIEVSSEQLSKYMFENYSNQGVAMLMQQMNMAGMEAKTPQEAHDMIFNPKKYGIADAQVEGLQLAWINLENEAKQQLKTTTYASLLQGAFQANDLDKAALYNDVNTTYNVKMAYKPYGQLDETKYPVTDAELKEEYAKVMNQYRLDEPSKSVQVITVTISPSADDIKASKELARNAVASLQKTGDINKDLKGMGVVINHKALREKDITGMTKTFVTTAPKDSISIVKEDINGFTVVKMGKKGAEVDSIQLNMVQVVGANLPAKVMASLNAGVSIDSIQSQYKDSVMVQKEMWQPLITAQGRAMIDKAQVDTLLNAGTGYFELVKMPEGAVLVQVVKKNAPVQVYEYDEVTYVLEPSDKTIRAEREKLEKFIAENNTAEKFVANAAKAGYTNVPYIVGASTPGIGGGQMYQPNTRQVVKWAVIDASAGQVSEVFDYLEGTRPNLYVAAVEAEYDTYLPYNHGTVKPTLERAVRCAKAGEEMAKQYAGKKTVDEVAQLMSVTASERPIEFGNPMRAGDETMLGQIVNTKVGAPVVIVKGKNGVYAYQVISIVDNKLEKEDSKYAQQYMTKHRPDFTKILRGNKEIVNDILKFYGGSR